MLAILFQNYLLQAGKIWLLFAQLYKNSTYCFVLEVLTESRFQNRICIANREKENKNLYIAHEEMGDYS